jgi:VIT1/CCC1 family predicted Fe2+/Mn2+ transporter
MYPRSTHIETHFTGSATVRDIVIGMSDGLTVPFALAAGLSGAVASSFLVLVAGVAEMAAGSIAMGLGGYLAANGEADSYRAEYARESREVRDLPDAETTEVRQIFEQYSLRDEPLDAAVKAVTSNPKSWVDFMMREELGLEEPHPGRALRSALTIGLAYVAGGIVPLAPYALGLPLNTALLVSVALTLVALVVFGAVKGHFTGVSPVRGALQTAIVGAVAAGAAYGLARLVTGLGAR